MRVAIIKNGVVTNVIISNTIPENGVDITNKHVGIGYTYENNNFVAPVVEAPAPNTILSRFAFRNLFTLAEKQTIYAEADTNIIVKIFLDEITVAENVDLANEATIVGVNYLESQGLIAAGRAAEILGS